MIAFFPYRFPNKLLVGTDTALFRLKRYGEALAAMEQAIRLDPYNGEFYYGKGSVLRALGRAAEANQALKKARELGFEDED